MLVGPHERPLYQMLQLLLFSLLIDHNSSCVLCAILCNIWSTLVILGSQCCTYLGRRQLWFELASFLYLKTCQVVFSNLMFGLTAATAGVMLNPVRFGIDKLASGADRRSDFVPQATVWNVTGYLLWWPLFVVSSLHFGFDVWLGHGYGFVFVMAGLQWWLKGISVAAESILIAMERPEPWPDPAPLEYFGYSTRLCYYKQSSGHSKPKQSGWITTTSPTYVCARTGFSSLLCWSLWLIVVSFIVAMFDMIGIGIRRGHTWWFSSHPPWLVVLSSRLRQQIHVHVSFMAENAHPHVQQAHEHFISPILEHISLTVRTCHRVLQPFVGTMSSVLRPCHPGLQRVRQVFVKCLSSFAWFMDKSVSASCTGMNKMKAVREDPWLCMVRVWSVLQRQLISWCVDIRRWVQSLGIYVAVARFCVFGTHAARRFVSLLHWCFFKEITMTSLDGDGWLRTIRVYDPRLPSPFIRVYQTCFRGLVWLKQATQPDILSVLVCLSRWTSGIGRTFCVGMRSFVSWLVAMAKPYFSWFSTVDSVSKQQLQTRVVTPRFWTCFKPFKECLNMFPWRCFDIDSMRDFSVWAPEFEDDADVSFYGYNWRLRRHIRRVEAKQQQKQSKPKQVPPRPPPPEPPPIPSWPSDPRWPTEQSKEQLTDDLLHHYQDLQDRLAEQRRTRWEWLVYDFVGSHDPSRITDALLFGASFTQSFERKVSLPIGRAYDFATWRALLHHVDLKCFQGLANVGKLLVIDSGASVCISPDRSDFISYRPSKIKIKDLSSSNTVAGEGMIRWPVRDKNGRTVVLELPGYHIPNAEVRLLSPQVLLQLAGGKSDQSIQTTAGINIVLENGIELFGNYCPRSNLPLLSVTDDPSPRSFWSDAFAYTAKD